MSPTHCAVLIVLLEGLSFGLILPVLSDFCTSLGGSASLAGLLFALVSGPKVLTNPLFGKLSDRVGRRPVLAINTLGTLAGSLVWALCSSLWMLAFSRLITGIFSAQAGLVQAMVADRAPPERRAAAMGMLGAAFGVSFSVGPVLGGWTAHHFSHASVGWVCAAMQLTSLLLIAFVLPESLPRESRRNVRTPAFRDELALASTPQVARLLLVTVLMTLGTSHLIATFSLVAGERYQMTVAMAGYAFAVIGLVGIVVQGGLIRPLTRRFSERGIAQAGLLLLAAGLALLAVGAGAWSFWSAAVVVGLGSALAAPCLTSLLSRSVGSQDQGAINGLNQSSLAVGRAGGNLLGGALYDRSGIGACYGSAAVFATLGLLLLLRRPREPRPVARDSATGELQPAVGLSD